MSTPLEAWLERQKKSEWNVIRKDEALAVIEVLKEALEEIWNDETKDDNMMWSVAGKALDIDPKLL